MDGFISLLIINIQNLPNWEIITLIPHNFLNHSSGFQIKFLFRAVINNNSQNPIFVIDD